MFRPIALLPLLAAVLAVVPSAAQADERIVRRDAGLTAAQHS